MKSKLFNILILASVLLIPLLGAYNSFGYEQIKVLFFILSITLIGFIWLWRKPEFKWGLIKITSLLFILVLFITSALGVDFKSSFLGKEPYFQGLALYAYLFLFSLFISSAKIKLEHVAIVLAGSAMAVSLVAIKAWILLNIFNMPVPIYAGRVVSTFGQPNFYAGFLLLTLPFSYYLLVIARSRRRRGNLSWKIATLTMFARDDKLRILGWGSGLVSLIGILLSYSRSAILMALLLLVAGLLSQLKIKLKVILIFAGVFVLLLALKFSSGTFGIVWNEFSYPNSHNNPDLTKMSVEKRAYIWPVAWQLFLQRPILGYGLENINESFADYFATNKHRLFEENLNISPVLISLKELNIDRSHNYILDLLLFAGLPGLLVWVFLVALLLRRSRGVLLVSLVTYLVWVQFQNQSVVHLVYFWLLAGLIDQKLT